MEEKNLLKGQSPDKAAEREWMPDLRHEQMAILCQSARSHIPANVITSGILVFMLYPLVPRILLGAWFGANLLLAGVRFLMFTRHRPESEDDLKSVNWTVRVMLLLLLSAMVWGSAGIVLFVRDSVVHQAFLALVTGGMAVGAVGAYAVVFEIAIAYVLLVVLPITVQFFLLGTQVHIAVGCLMILFLVPVLMAARNIHRAAIRSLQLRFEKYDLVRSLTNSKNQADILNLKLQAEIEARQLTLEALHDSEQKLKKILEDSPVSTFVLDKHHRVIHWNKALERLSGIRKEEVVGSTHPWKAFYDKERPCLCNLLLDDQMNELSKWYPGKHRPSDLIQGAYEATDFFPGLGEHGKWLRFTAAKIYDSAANIFGVIEVIEDITERKQAQENLQKSEEYFRTLIENSSDYILIVNDQAIIKYASPSVKKDLGYSQEEVGEQNIFVFAHPDELPEAARLFRQILEKPGETIDAEIRGRAKDGSYRHFAIKGRNFLDHPGIQGIVLNAWDLTGPKKTLAALHQAEEKYRQLFENVPVGLFRSSPEGKLIEANPALAQIFGYPSREDLMKIPLPDLYATPEDRKQWQRIMDRVGIVRNYEFQLVRADGNPIWGKGTTQAFRDSSGRVLYYEGVLEDITERKEAENRLRESEKRFRELVEQSLTGIFIVQNGWIVYRNSEHEKMQGPLPPGYRFGCFGDVHPEDLEKARKYYDELLAHKVPPGEFHVRLSPPGKAPNEPDYRWYQIRGSLIEYQGQEAQLFNMVDITKIIELEHLAMINDKMTSLGRVAAGIIHELRSPLSGINVYLTTLKKMYEAPGGPKGDYLEKTGDVLRKLQSASNKIESVIKRVMDFAKPSGSRLTLTHLNQSVEEAVNLSLATLRKNGIAIKRSLSAAIPPCYANPHQIEQVILNLITNAVQAMKAASGDKKIELSSWSEANWVCIGVADSGPGVPVELRRKIFDPFFTTKPEGVGIGLSLCNRIITDHGGLLSLQTSKWGGAEFHLKIPIEKRKGSL